jgi:hypothetical protein
MRKSKFLSLTLVLALVVAASGCDNGDTIPVTPTTPSTTVTETFSGSLTVNGAVTFNFSTTSSGAVVTSLRTVGPNSTVQLGLALGTWNGVSCALVISNDRSQAGTSVTGQVNAAGTLCTRVYDVGQLTGPATFEIVVVHP